MLKKTNRRSWWALPAALSLLLMAAAPHQNDKKGSVIDEALAKAYPGAKIERVTCVLTPEQRKKVGKLGAQDGYPRKTTFAYLAKKDGKVVGTAFFDSHVVRTKRETLMLLVSPEGALAGVETLAFKEPPEYMAQDSFFRALKGRRQGRDLQLGRGLDGTTGATLTCAAVAKAGRRVLGLHAVLGKKVGRSTVGDEPKPTPKPSPKPPKKDPSQGKTRPEITPSGAARTRGL
ncbi:MAG: hypothetical protein ACJA2W_000410 [Planctomycetota bacterium]|jgi:electron transport complex protein RnfG